MRPKNLGALFTTAVFAASMAVARPAQSAKDQSQSTPREKTEHIKTETPSRTTKAKEVTVIGKVRAFEAGKKIQVTTPRKGHRTFDLSAKNTTVNGAENVKVGEMVKVTEKTEHGQHTITIEPYTSAAAKGKTQRPKPQQ